MFRSEFVITKQPCCTDNHNIYAQLCKQVCLRKQRKHHMKQSMHDDIQQLERKKFKIPGFSYNTHFSAFFLTLV